MQDELAGGAEAAAWWRTSLTRIAPGRIEIRGYPIEQLIAGVSFAEMVWLMLRGELPDRRQATMLNAALVASVDHGPQAPSIAAARMAATCGVGLNNAVATGINMLGDVHGGAGQQCMEMLDSLSIRVAEGEAADAAVADLVDSAQAQGRRLPGFGHRFHPRDPRREVLASELRRAEDDGVVGGRYLQIAERIEERLASANRPIPMNIDGITAVVYAELGFSPQLARGLFVLSRSVGVLAHAWEESRSGARIKGPVPSDVLAEYAGPASRDIPLAPRGTEDKEGGLA